MYVATSCTPQAPGVVITTLATVPSDRSDDDLVDGFDRADIVLLADNFSHLVRAFSRVRARWLAAAEHDVEWSAHILLKTVQNEGPMRAGAVAEALRFDPSTVSRQVAALVKDGLLERRADPGDGRASLLVLTDRAHEVLAEHEDVRLHHFTELLRGWTAADVAQLARLLGRFADAYVEVAPGQLDEKIRSRSTS